MVVYKDKKTPFIDNFVASGIQLKKSKWFKLLNEIVKGYVDFGYHGNNFYSSSYLKIIVSKPLDIKIIRKNGIFTYFQRENILMLCFKRNGVVLQYNYIFSKYKKKYCF